MTELKGELLIGGESVFGSGPAFFGVSAAEGVQLAPAYGSATKIDAAQACAKAAASFNAFRQTSPETRAAFLELAAAKIDALGDALTDRACAETGLPRARIEGERGRTVLQLRLFASEVRTGNWQDVRVDPALPDRKPLPRPDLRLRMIPLGPVVVFGASNFPLAFSVAGGDTASALAAGCPVVVKAHRAHPGTSELVGRAIQEAVAEAGLPDGVFSLLFSADDILGSWLVQDPQIKAVGFTGSRTGGLALAALAAQRPEPIPFYGEMSSINPVLLLPGALAEKGTELGKAYVGSLTTGAGQLCTNPGLLLAMKGDGLEDFTAAAGEALATCPAATMLHKGILVAYETGVAQLAKTQGVWPVGCGQSADNAATAQFFRTDSSVFRANPHLYEEIFGAAGLLVEGQDEADLTQIILSLEGQLTVTVHMTTSDEALFTSLLPLLEQKAGRVLVNGWPTGVEVCHAMVHGGPFPSTSDSRTTSVGTLAIRRFLRPVCYQNFAEYLLPEALQDTNPNKLWRTIDGQMTSP